MNEDNNINEQNLEQVAYTDDNIRHLSDMEHVRTRPGMYIGRLGDGSLPEDGIYVLLKEVIDNSIDEFKMKAGDRIEININRPDTSQGGWGRVYFCPRLWTRYPTGQTHRGCQCAQHGW